MRKFSPFVFLLLFAASCVQNTENNEAPARTFIASSEYGSGTRTSLDGISVLWAADDMISVFNAATPNGENYNILSEDAGKNRASFTGTDIGGAPWYALYPADESASVSSGTLTLSLPAVQQYAEAGFGPGSNPMVAVSSTTSLDFKNLCGLLKLSLTGSGSVKSIVLTTAGEEPLWGKAEVSMDYTDVPSLNMVQAAGSEFRSITLDCGAGTELGNDPVQFFFVLPAGALSAGFNVAISDAEGNTVSRSTTKDLSILRSKIKSMQTIDCQLSGSPFLLAGAYGVYDLSGSDPVPVRVFGPDDQLALRRGSAKTFRIQSLINANAVSISFPDAMAVGESYDITIASEGSTGVDDCAISAVLLQQEDGKCWLEDKNSKVGYIIASEL